MISGPASAAIEDGRSQIVYCGSYAAELGNKPSFGLGQRGRDRADFGFEPGLDPVDFRVESGLNRVDLGFEPGLNRADFGFEPGLDPVDFGFEANV